MTPPPHIGYSRDFHFESCQSLFCCHYPNYWRCRCSCLSFFEWRLSNSTAFCFHPTYQTRHCFNFCGFAFAKVLSLFNFRFDFHRLQLFLVVLELHSKLLAFAFETNRFRAYCPSSNKFNPILLIIIKLLLKIYK